MISMLPKYGLSLTLDGGVESFIMSFSGPLGMAPEGQKTMTENGTHCVQLCRDLVLSVISRGLGTNCTGFYLVTLGHPNSFILPFLNIY